MYCEQSTEVASIKRPTKESIIITVGPNLFS